MSKYLFIAANEGHRWGGSEPLWSSAAEKLARRGNEVRVSVKDWGEPVPQIEQLRSAGCQIFYRRNPLPSFIARQVQKVFPPLPYLETHLRSAGSGVDLVVISQTYNIDGLQWMEIARAAGNKYAAVCQSAVVYWWPDDDVAERLATGYENARATDFVSQANLDLSRRQFGSALHNAKVVRNPFNVRYDAQPPWPSDSSDGLALACVGRLDVISKAQDVLLEVLGLPHWRERKVRLSLIGMAIGIAAACGLTRLLQSFLFGVEAWDPLVFVTVPLLLGVATLGAVWFPARRAAGTDPAEALRQY